MPEFFRKTARFMAVSFFLASTAAADTGADAQGSIITDNFALVASGSEDALPGPLARDPEGSAYLGTVGQFKVVPGNKAPEHLAFVKKANGSGYIIENRIIVTCSKKNLCTLPDYFQAEQLGKRRYEITVNDYETWKLYMDELKSIDGVEKVSPSLFYGKKQGLK